MQPIWAKANVDNRHSAYPCSKAMCIEPKIFCPSLIGHIYVYKKYILFIFSNIFYTEYSDMHICIAQSFTQLNPVNVFPGTDNITQYPYCLIRFTCPSIGQLGHHRP